MGKKQNAHQIGHFMFQNALPFAEEKFPYIGHPTNTLEIFCGCFMDYETSITGR
jgi:hypothetical protein